MDKPTMKREIAIRWAYPDSGTIYMYATPDAAAEFAAFGTIGIWQEPAYYRLEVDGRFDFLEVVKYIEVYGKDA